MQNPAHFPADDCDSAVPLSYPTNGFPVNTSLLCLLMLAGADPSAGRPQQHLRSDSPFLNAVSADGPTPLVVRAQNSPFFGDGSTGTPPTYAPPGGTISPSPTLGTVDPFTTTPVVPYGAPITGDPFLGGAPTAVPPGYTPFGQPPAAMYTFGLNGPQPFQYGWHGRYDFGILPSEGTSNPNVGSFSVFEIDVEKELVTPTGSGHTFSFAPQFNYRSWSGPVGDPTVPFPATNWGLPPSVYRFGLGFKLHTPNVNGWQFELGFNPSIGADFNSTLTSDAWMFDGHAVAFFRSSPQWMWAIGAAYWDRVDNIVLPYAGAVWTPNDYWEFRLLFPKPRISLFVGAPFGVPTWLYAAGEYHVEAYQVEMDVAPARRSTRVQLEDWRVVGGARWEMGSVTGFLEAGVVFERDVDFRDAFGTDFEIDSGFIARAGFRY